MTRILLLAGAAFAAVVLAAQAGAMSNPAVSNPKLKGDVGPGFTIHLKDATGHAVKTLKAGTYTITVVDKSNIHNFHLTGPGVNKQITAIGFRGTKTVTVTLKKGTYKYVCDPHVTTMNGSFKVT